MAQSFRKDLAARLIEHAGQGDVEMVEVHLAPDFVLEQMVRDPETHTSADGTRYDRKSYLGFLGAVREMTRTGMNLTIDLVAEDGDNVIVFGTSDAQSPRGWNYRNAYCWHLVFRADKVTLLREYYDTALGHRLMQG